MQKPGPASKEPILFKHHLHAAGKFKYVGINRTNSKCILCAIAGGDEDVESLKIYQEPLLFITLNLYPYNPGHLMVCPTRHVEKFADLTEKERNRIFHVTIQAQTMLREIFTPTGFNVGCNEGDFSGASINHIHIHVVPRYRNEMGYIEILAETKITVLNVQETLAMILPRVNEFIKSPEM